RQADQRLDTGQENMAGALGVFLVEANRTLVNSHSTLAEAFGRPDSFLTRDLANSPGRNCHSRADFRSRVSQIWGAAVLLHNSQFHGLAWSPTFNLCRRQRGSRNDVTPL